MAGIFRIVLEGKEGTEDVQNSFFFRSVDFSALDDEDLVDALVASFNTNLIASMHQDYTLSSALISTHPGAGLTKFSVSKKYSFTQLVGGGGGDGLPEGTCLLLNFRNGEQTLNRKRVYVGPWSESVSTNKRPVTAIINQAQAFIDDVVAGFTVSTHLYLPCTVRLDSLGRYVDDNLLFYGFPSPKWSKLRSRQST